MQYFWQLSGPESHIGRSWHGKVDGNVIIASQVFKALSRKREDGSGRGIDLILGIEPSGASHILIPHGLRDTAPGLRVANWRRDRAEPYPASKYAALSPIYVDTDLRLQNILGDRQKISKNTKAGKSKGDNSRANGRFWNSPPNPARAAFEHGRFLWRVLREELYPQAYGLPDASWRRSVNIISLSLNLWIPDGTRLTDKLLDIGLTRTSLESIRREDGTADMTWYFTSEEHQGLQNPGQIRGHVISEAWISSTIPQANIGSKIREILETHAHPRDDPPAPLILLVHDYSAVKDCLETLGIRTSEWKYEVKELLGYHNFELHRDRDRQRQQFDIVQGTTSDPRRSSSSRARSRSPRASTRAESRRHSPSPLQFYAPIYIIDTVEMFKTVTGSGEHPRRIRPATVFNRLTGRSETDLWSAGSDTNLIMRSWKTMVQSLSIDEQSAFYQEHTRSEASWPAQRDTSGSAHAESEAPEDHGLFEQQQDGGVDLFNDGIDSDDEYY